MLVVTSLTFFFLHNWCFDARTRIDRRRVGAHGVPHRSAVDHAELSPDSYYPRVFLRQTAPVSWFLFFVVDRNATTTKKKKLACVRRRGRLGSLFKGRIWTSPVVPVPRDPRHCCGIPAWRSRSSSAPFSNSLARFRLPS